jgi:predicted O-linked N-acetylglucosamine transferase (SPINDLY family)
MIPPDQLRRLLQDAVTHQNAGRLVKADAIYRKIRAGSPNNFDATHLSGFLAIQRGRYSDAVVLLVAAHRTNPRSAICAKRLGFVLLALGRNAEAERPLRIAAQFNPKDAESWDLLARSLMLQDKLQAAIDCHKRVLSIEPNNVAYLYSYGTTLLQFGLIEEALACNERILAIDPSYAKGHYGKAQALHRLNRVLESVESYDQYIAREPENATARSFRLFALNNLDQISREKLYEEHVAYGRFVGAKAVPTFPNVFDPERRIRLAILSPDLRNHACAYFIEPLLQYIDRGKFEVYLYHDHYKEDSCSERLKKYASVWRNFVGQPGEVVEKTIRSDAPDVLMDLAGHIAISNRLPLFARHLAPVQITYLGYPNTTGLSAMGYRFVDEIVDPKGESDAYATERLVRFAPAAWSYLPPSEAPSIDELPARDGEGVVFGCFNSPGKITDAMLSAWGRLLQSVPGSQLLLKGPGFSTDGIRNSWTRRLSSCGIETDRVELLERAPGTREHLAQYHRVDIALDTFPYNGTTTTCEALWMGVPVVSLMGDRHAARVGGSLLTALGRTEWIAASPEEYIAVAARLAAKTADLRRNRKRLRTEMKESVLLDHAGQAIRFGDAIRSCWAEWCGRAGLGDTPADTHLPDSDASDSSSKELLGCGRGEGAVLSDS